MWWRFYSNVCAVDSSDYIRKISSRFKLRFNVGLPNCIVGIWYTCWDADNSVPLGWHGSAQGRLSQLGWGSTGTVPIGWLAPSGMPRLLKSQCAHHLWHKQRMAPRYVALQCRPQLCAQFQEDCPQNGWWVSCHHVPANPLSLWTHVLFQLHHLQCLPIPLKQPLFLMHCIILAYALQHFAHAFISTVLIVHVSQMCTSLILRTNCVHIYLL